MAATLVGGAFLSASVQTIIEKVASTEFRDYITNSKLNVSLLRQLETTLLTLQAVLDDAEVKQITIPSVKQWLDELKDTIFDAEDLLNQISFDSLRCKLENTKTNQVWNFLSSPFKNFYREINSEMKTICERLQHFSQHKDVLGLQTVSGRVSHRPPTSSVVNQSVMVGRKDDKEKLMKVLLSDSDTNSHNLGVLTILGMGGVGKTALTQLLYNDQMVQEHFDLKAWACVSEDFDVHRVTKTLLESVSSTVCEINNIDFLRVELKKNLRDKRFLIVLDDLWNDSYNDWDELVTPLMNGKIGSRVIITTRQQNVADATRTFPIHRLKPLSHEECWSLLSKHAFGSEDIDGSTSPNLEAIGKKIAKKCAGLPIAAKALGGVLRSKINEKEWTTILNNNIWDFPNDGVLPALLLSYQYLPCHLKRCFAYCSIFPKDYSLDKKQLVLLWMAEGFLEHSQDNKTLEEVGGDYFVELLSRSLIQQLNNDASEETFVMHDFVNDLATFVSGKSCGKLECDKISENVRHLSFNQDYDIFKKFEICYKFKSLRTFLPLSPIFTWERCLSEKVVDGLLPMLRKLRVLSLSGYRNINTLPDSIGNLVQLRYLNLSRTRIKRLPDTTCNLYHLQTLILRNCGCLTELPMNIGKLVNLRHLDVSGTNINELPMQIVELENLRTLTIFVIGEQQVGLSVRELRKFPHLSGELSILNLHNVIDAMEAYDANLKSKEQIEGLVLEWGKQTEYSQMAKAVLDMLQPSVKLKELTIKYFGGTSFPSWMGNSSFTNMVFLSIDKCEYCMTLPPLGQLPSIKTLRISRMTLETIGPEFYGMTEGGSISSFQPFPSLEYLDFEEMSNWKEWLPFESGQFPFPRLKYLSLIKCPELRGHLPAHLSSIEEIRIRSCDYLSATLHTLHWLSSIKTLHISECFFTEPLLLGNDSPWLLQSVSLSKCHTLLTSPKMIVSSACLQSLHLIEIPSLTAFPPDGLPTSLRSLYINGCQNITFLPPETWCKYTSLTELSLLNSCQTLTSFPLDGFPALQILLIQDCSSMESIFISESCTFGRSNLQHIHIRFCDALVSLPQRMDTLTALESLNLTCLPKIELSYCGGAYLPPKLKSISIGLVRLPSQGMNAWGLQYLTHLSELIIGGDDIVNDLLMGPLLPISLVDLDIQELSYTKFIEGNGLRHLSSLERLTFTDCPMLECLPEDTFPSSLKILSVWDCQLLEARYESEKREHCSKIAHIILRINGKVK